MIWHGSGTKRPERLTNGKSPGGRQGLSPGLLLGTRDNRLIRSATRYGKVPASRTSAPAISPSSPGHGLIAFATSPRSVRSVYSGVVQTALAWRSCSSSSFSQTEYVTLALPVTCTGMRQSRKPPTPSIRWKSEFPQADVRCSAGSAWIASGNNDRKSRSTPSRGSPQHEQPGTWSSTPGLYEKPTPASNAGRHYDASASTSPRHGRRRGTLVEPPGAPAARHERAPDRARVHTVPRCEAGVPEKLFDHAGLPVPGEAATA